jgi:hypothetical protein
MMNVDGSFAHVNNSNIIIGVTQASMLLELVWTGFFEELPLHAISVPRVVLNNKYMHTLYYYKSATSEALF